MGSLFNGNQDYGIGLERVRYMKDNEVIVFRFRGGVNEKRQPCRTLVSRLYAYCKDFRIKTIDGCYEYNFKNDSFGDFLSTTSGDSLYIGRIDEIIVGSNTQGL